MQGAVPRCAQCYSVPPQMAMQLMFNQNTNSKMPGLIGKKIGMTSVFGADGKNIPCTVIEAGPCVVTQIRTEEKDGYAAVQLAYDEQKEKHTSASLMGHFKKANTTPKRKLVEFKNDFERLPGRCKAPRIRRRRWSDPRSGRQTSCSWFYGCIILAFKSFQGQETCRKNGW